MVTLAGKKLQDNLELYRTLGNNITRLRHLIPITQGQLGAALGVSHDTIHHIEAAKSRTEIALVWEIARLFGISTDLLCSTRLELSDIDQDVIKRIHKAFYPNDGDDDSAPSIHLKGRAREILATEHLRAKYQSRYGR